MSFSITPRDDYLLLSWPDDDGITHIIELKDRMTRCSLHACSEVDREEAQRVAEQFLDANFLEWR